MRAGPGFAISRGQAWSIRKVPMTLVERRATRRESPVAFKPRYIREQRMRRPYWWLIGRQLAGARPRVPALYRETPTTNVATYPLVVSPVTAAISEETLSANTMSPELEVGFCPFEAYAPLA